MKYKDRVFRMIFGYEKYKENLLELFNALNDTNYTNPDTAQKRLSGIMQTGWTAMRRMKRR